jgi:hypothetical protein
LRLCRREKATYQAGKQQGFNICDLETHLEFDKIPPETFGVKIGVGKCVSKLRFGDIAR